MQWLPVAALSGALLLVGGCFDRDNGHPGKDDADTTKPSLQMQQPSEKRMTCQPIPWSLKPGARATPGK